MTEATTQPAYAGLWNRLTAILSQGELPTRDRYVDLLVNMSGLEAVFLVAIGAVYLLCGWKVFKALVIANACLIGAVLGGLVGARLTGQSMTIIGAAAGAALFGVLAWPAMKYAVALMGGLAGSFIGFGLWTYVASISGSEAPAQYAWAGALLGLVTLGMLALVVFRESIIFFTAFQGALLVVTGASAVAMNIDSVRGPLSRGIVNNIHILPVLIIVPTLIGLVFQHSGLAKKKRKKAKQPVVV